MRHLRTQTVGLKRTTFCLLFDVMQACKNFMNGDKCEGFCPRSTIYDPEKYKHMPNPNAKYAYGTLCVDECPGT